MAKLIVDLKDETKAVLDRYVEAQGPKTTIKEVVLRALGKMIPELKNLD